MSVNVYSTGITIMRIGDKCPCIATNDYVYCKMARSAHHFKCTDERRMEETLEASIMFKVLPFQ